MRYWSFPDFLFAFVLSAFACLGVYTFLILLPTTAIAHKQCLEQGFPDSEVTYDLKKYCITMTGAAQMYVEKVE